MTSLGHDDDAVETTISASIGARRGSRLWLLVLKDDVAVTYPLPDRGALKIGRGAGSDVHLDDKAASRTHALLHVDGVALRIEDAGSANGTRLRDRQLAANEPTELLPGDVVDIGATMLVVQRHATGTPEPRRFWSHAQFETRIEEESARASRASSSYAIARLQVGALPPPTVERALSRTLRACDAVSASGQGEYEILLVDLPAGEAEQIVDRLARQLGAGGTEIRLGIVSCPRDGRGARELFARLATVVRPFVPGADSTEGVVVTDPSMQRVHRLIERIAPAGISVLLLGETGVGKEVLAEMLHKKSPRADKPFVRLNCAALSDSLLESELFGHERGAFTGAVQAKVGLLESADGGTVFLDEIGDLPMSMQVKLLRVIETRQLLRVGSVKVRPIDVRFLSATNRDLEAAIEAGSFRQDLYFRLNGVTILVPPLRERVVEIERLARSFLAQAARAAGREPPVLSREALALLENYRWPGNIRELRNVIERAVLLCEGGALGPDHLPLERMRAPARPSTSSGPVAVAPSVAVADVSPGAHSDPEADTDGDGDGNGGAAMLREELKAVERQRIVEALERCGGNQTRAAGLLGISRRSLVSRLAQYGLPRPRKDRDTSR